MNTSLEIALSLSSALGVEDVVTARWNALTRDIGMRTVRDVIGVEAESIWLW
jgi:hypothetical protein